jgi:hypothetical protein
VFLTWCNFSARGNSSGISLKDILYIVGACITFLVGIFVPNDSNMRYIYKTNEWVNLRNGSSVNGIHKACLRPDSILRFEEQKDIDEGNNVHTTWMRVSYTEEYAVAISNKCTSETRNGNITGWLNSSSVSSKSRIPFLP